MKIVPGPPAPSGPMTSRVQAALARIKPEIDRLKASAPNVDDAAMPVCPNLPELPEVSEAMVTAAADAIGQHFAPSLYVTEDFEDVARKALAAAFAIIDNASVPLEVVTGADAGAAFRRAVERSHPYRSDEGQRSSSPT